MHSISGLFAGVDEAPECGTLTSRPHRLARRLVLPEFQEWKLDKKVDEAQARCWVLRVRLHTQLAFQRIGSRRLRRWSEYRPHLENFTVDASIFVVTNKLLRAVGGCLGTKSR